MNGSVCCGTLAGTIVKMLIRKSSFPIRSRALAMGQIASVIRSKPESVSSAALVSVALVQALFRNEVYSAVAGLRNCLPSGTVSVVVSVSPAWADSRPTSGTWPD